MAKKETKRSLTPKEQDLVKICKSVIKYCSILDMPLMPKDRVSMSLEMVREYKSVCIEASNSNNDYVARNGKKALQAIKECKFLNESEDIFFEK